MIGELVYFGGRESDLVVPRFRHLAGRGSNPRQVIDDAVQNAGAAKNGEESAGGSKVTILAFNFLDVRALEQS